MGGTPWWRRTNVDLTLLGLLAVVIVVTLRVVTLEGDATTSHTTASQDALPLSNTSKQMAEMADILDGPEEVEEYDYDDDSDAPAALQDMPAPEDNAITDGGAGAPIQALDGDAIPDGTPDVTPGTPKRKKKRKRKTG